MESKLQEQINELELKVDRILVSTQKTERYMRITFWTTIVIVVLPLLIALFVVPVLIGQVTEMYTGIITV